jgi:hypothetical protein
MSDDKLTYTERLKGIIHSDRPATPTPNREHEGDGVEASCPAFGYLRGIRETAAAVELRFKDGKSMWFPYNWLGTWQHNPGDGLLLKFSGDMVYLVLIKGSNLDKPLNEGSINLTRGGLQRHRVLWLREMSAADIKEVGEEGPTIDSIEVASFESHEALKEWLDTNAPAFRQ